MSFGERLAAAANQVEACLGDILASEGRDGAPDRLVAAMRHASLGGGKRLRPFLVLEAATVCGADPARAVRAGAALECIHCYSLVHDDLPAMDDDDLRRGRPTVHKAFDDWTAILAGDGLLTLAFAVLADPATHPKASVRADLVALYARAAGGVGMVGGQALDLAFDKLRDPAAPDLAHVARLQAMKTGALIEAACVAGAILAQADAATTAAIRTYGAAVGAAFQIADDLLDLEGDAAVVGKAVGKDARKATMVALLGPAAARARLAELQADALAALAPFGPRAATLHATVTFVAARQS